MSNIIVIYVGNDSILEVDHVRDELTGDFLAGAAVQATMFDNTGAEVTGDTWPRPLAYVANSKGVYRTTLPQTLDLTANQRYTVEVEVNDGPGRYAKWTLQCVARERDC